MGDFDRKIQNPYPSFQAIQRAVSSLERKGVTDQEIDHDQDGSVDFFELVSTLYNHPDWKKFQQERKWLGLKLPIDTPPPQIVQRGKQLKEKIDRELSTKHGVKPGDQDYFRHFLPRFHKATLPSYQQGGVGIGYPFENFLLEKNEMTGSEAFRAVLHPKNPKYEWGSCTEASYKMLSLHKAVVPHSPLAICGTQNHLYPCLPEEKESSQFDPSEIGAVGWTRVYTSQQEIAADYYAQVASDALEKGEFERAVLALATADAILGKERSSEIVETTRTFFLGITGTHDAIISQVRKVIEENPENIASFLNYEKHLSFLTDPILQLQHALQLVKTFPKNAYAFQVLANISVRAGLVTEAIAGLKKNGFEAHALTLRAFKAFAEEDALRNIPSDQHDKPQNEPQNEPETGISLAEKALKKDPQHGYLLGFLAEQAFAQGDLQQAEHYITRAIQVAPNLPGVHELLSDIYAGKGMKEKAYAEAKRAYFSFPGNSQAQLSLGFRALEAGDPKTAINFMVRYLVSNFGDPSAYQCLAYALESLGNDPETLQTILTSLQKILKEDRTQEVREVIESIFRGGNALERALRAVTHAQKLADKMEEQYGIQNPQLQAELTQHLSYLLFQKGEPQQALQLAQKAYQLNPHSQGIHALLTSALLFHGHYEEALKVARNSTTSFPQISTAWSNLASAYQAINRRQEAEKVNRKALELNPENMEALFTDLWFDIEKQHPKAEEKLQKLRNVYGKLGGFSSLDATASLSLGKFNHARMAAKKALQQNPHDVHALFVQTQLALRKRKTKTALKLAKQVESLAPTHYYAPLIHAQTYLQQGQLKKAESAALEALRRYPYDSGTMPLYSARLVLIDVLERQDRIQEAQAIRTEMQKLQPIRSATTATTSSR